LDAISVAQNFGKSKQKFMPNVLPTLTVND
jgi:hypothetical protein